MKWLDKVFIMAVFVGLGIFSSCDNSTSIGVNVNTAEVYTRSININNVNKHALVFFLDANSDLKSVNVTDPNGNKYALNSYWISGNQSVRRIPDMADYTTTLPISGIYRFSAQFTNNDTITVNDNLGTSAIGVVKIDTFLYRKNVHDIYVNWDNIENADFYFIRIASILDTFPHFQSQYYSNGPANISTTSFRWYVIPSDGDNLVFSLHAFNRNNSNVESESIDTLRFTW